VSGVTLEWCDPSRLLSLSPLKIMVLRCPQTRTRLRDQGLGVSAESQRVKFSDALFFKVKAEFLLRGAG
jgi:hypothetical protein